MREMGGPPNVDPGGDYDYRKAWLYGATPQLDPVSGTYHGVSAVEAPPYAQPLHLKSADHPTAWMEAFMQLFGVDPRTVQPEQITPQMVDFVRSLGVVPSTGADPSRP